MAEVAAASTADGDGYVIVAGRRVRMMAGLIAKKTRRTKAALTAAALSAEEQVSQSLKAIKTSLTAKELKAFMSMLYERRKSLMHDLGAMENHALRANKDGSSQMPIHPADLGSDTYDQDLNLGLAAKERQLIREIDEAIQRIKKKTYGICQASGKVIPLARLNAKPWAKYTVEAARERERHMNS